MLERCFEYRVRNVVLPVGIAVLFAGCVHNEVGPPVSLIPVEKTELISPKEAVPAESVPPQVAPIPAHKPVYRQVGVASWYGKPFHGRRTASGRVYDMYALTAAHRSLPLGTKLKVTNLANNRSTVVIVNDRGPYVDGRIIDVSMRVAGLLGFKSKGLAKVRLEIIA